MRDSVKHIKILVSYSGMTTHHHFDTPGGYNQSDFEAFIKDYLDCEPRYDVENPLENSIERNNQKFNPIGDLKNPGPLRLFKPLEYLIGGFGILMNTTRKKYEDLTATEGSVKSAHRIKDNEKGSATLEPDYRLFYVEDENGRNVVLEGPEELEELSDIVDRHLSNNETG